jgi:hypothetical protein
MLRLSVIDPARSTSTPWERTLPAVFATVSTDAKVLEDPDYAGKPLPNVPKHTGSLFLTYDIHIL